MFFSEHRLKIASLRIGKHRIVKNIASLRKVKIAHPYRDKGDGSCFKMQVKLNYDHNHEMTSCDAWNFLEVYQDTK
jgi:hypothetical protein